MPVHNNLTKQSRSLPPVCLCVHVRLCLADCNNVCVCVCDGDTKNVCLSLLNLPPLSHSEPKYTHFHLAVVAVQAYFEKLVIWWALETKWCWRSCLCTLSVCFLSLSLWFRLADMEICAAEVREEGLEHVGLCVFPQLEKKLGCEEHC